MQINKRLSFLIATLSNDDKAAVFDHLMRLSPDDRYMRFFAHVNDTLLIRYVETMDMDRNKSFGIFAEDRKTLIAFAHVSGEERKGNIKFAELGISVDETHRRHGLAQRLMDRITVYCKANDIHTLYMSCLRENKTMQHLAKKAGMRVVLEHTEAIAELQLDNYPMDKAISMSHEIAYEQIAIVDRCYRMNTELVEGMLKGLK